MPSQETLRACLLVLTRSPRECHSSWSRNSHLLFLRRHGCFNSAGMTFLLEQGLEIEIGFVALEEASLLLSVGAKTPALKVSESIQALERFEVKALVVVGAVEASTDSRDNALEQGVGNIVQACHALLFTKRHASQRWRHEQQLSSIGLHRQLRSCGISRSLYLRSGALLPLPKGSFTCDKWSEMMILFPSLSTAGHFQSLPHWFHLLEVWRNVAVTLLTTSRNTQSRHQIQLQRETGLSH